MRRLLRPVESLRIDLPGGPAGLQITCSAGVAALAGDMPGCKALLDAAGRNLYPAKQQGGTRAVAGTEPADAPVGG